MCSSLNITFFLLFQCCSTCDQFNMSTSLTKIPAVTKLSDRIIRILGCNPGPMTLQGTNSYIIGTGKRRILLDTTEPGSSATQYIDHLKTVFLQENFTLSHILLSHWHYDHVGAVENVLGLKDNLSDCTVWKFPSQGNEDASMPNIKFEHLKDNQELQVDGATIRVLHTPGHTTDHVVLQLKEENAVFSGDCILGEGTSVFEDLFDYMKSLEIILGLKPTVVYPAHGNVINDAQQKIKYYIAHRNERERQILDVLKVNPIKTFNEMELVKEIYTETPEHFWKPAAYNVKHHLVKLLKENKVIQVESQWKYKDVSKI